MRDATIGFRAKTGKAIAVALSAGPEFVQRWTVDLVDPDIPATSQPHHEVMELSWPEAQKAVQPIERRIDEVAADRVRGMIEELRSRDFKVSAIGVVGSPDRDLSRIGNPHIRAHAAEGILFRHAIEVAAKQLRVRCQSFSDRGFEEAKVTKTLGRAAGRPWRADERAAATAAWLMIS
ncbi:MAG TPA: hypothetical protein VGK04_06930 [Thermoanaerobaculia bacterium]|jgi:hypothetical protein